MSTRTRIDGLAEIRSHLVERAQQFREQGSAQPEQEAIRALGDPKALALQFSLEALEQKARHSFQPWVLLRTAWWMAMLGMRGTVVFFIGLFGYSFAVAALIAPIMKLFLPQTGVWISPHGFLIGASSNPSGYEIAGSSFVYLMVVTAFLVGSATTFLLRWLMQFWKPSKPVLTTRVEAGR